MPVPERHVTLAYAATASLAAVTLVYVFAPTWFIDSPEASSKDRKKGVVGLTNTANDCFINSVLQALAGLEHLRTYLSDRTRIANRLAELNAADGLTLERKPFLTAALKEVLDSLNERPLYRKTISNRPFLIVLERVFKQKISRQQQDAHEFLQVVAETLAEELRQQRKQEEEAVESKENSESIEDVLSDPNDADDQANEPDVIFAGADSRARPPPPPKIKTTEESFVGVPLEGRLRSEIECQLCGFKPAPTISSFVVLTLPVPEKSSVSLSECIDGTLANESIDDFQCAKCRMNYALRQLQHKLTTTTSNHEDLENSISKLTEALEKDPETMPSDIVLPSLQHAPKTTITKRTQIEDYPEIFVFHLSRSIYDVYSRKNSAKVSFPETLQLGGLLERNHYRLLCVVTHKGGHDSGHYECFRRQIVSQEPYPTPIPSPLLKPSTPLSSSPINRSSPRLSEETSSSQTTGSLLSPSTPTSWNSTSTSTPPSSMSFHTDDSTPRVSTPVPSEAERTKFSKKKLKKKNRDNKWWRISDDKAKEAKTNDVLGMQKEVYLLFYQRTRTDRLLEH